MVPNQRLSSASQLTQRLLWNRALAGEPRPLPVLVLLGPVGAGKTHALASVSADCGDSFVHSRPYSFENADAARTPKPATTVSVLTEIAGSLSRGWAGRPKARFHRFTLAWIAAHQHLAGKLHDQSKDALRESIEDLSRKSSDGLNTAAGVMIDAAATASGLPGPAATVLKDVLPPLIRALGRQPLRQAKRWHTGFPAAEGAPPLDALFVLSGLAAEGRQDAVTDWLMDAFLADVRDSYPRMARDDPRGSCGCTVPGKGHHWHNWVLLLDDTDQPAGARFLDDLGRARQRLTQNSPGAGYDPLLVVAASGRWNHAWDGAWRPPWEHGPASPGGARTVPRCEHASYQGWHPPGTQEQPFPYFPVLLEPLSAKQVGAMIGVSEYSPECTLASRATGGLPGAVREVGPLLAGRRIPEGKRDALAGPARPPAAAWDDPWSARLERLRLLEHLHNLQLPDLVAAAPFATAPWLVPHDANSPVSPNLGLILTELRTALWVREEMHPWLANNLNRALARISPEPGLVSSYDSRFEKLLADQIEQDEPVRAAYCRLALRKFSDAVDHLVAIFDKVPHREWNGQLSLITRAPDNLPLQHTAWTLYESLVQADGQEREAGRPTIRNAITRLVAARWLGGNDFTMPHAELKRRVDNSYEALQMLSKRPDVGDLRP